MVRAWKRTWNRVMARITLERLLWVIEKKEMLAKLATGRSHPKTLDDRYNALQALLSMKKPSLRKEAHE